LANRRPQAFRQIVPNDCSPFGGLERQPVTTSEQLRSRPTGEGPGAVRLSRRDAEDLLRLLRILSSGLMENSPSTIDRAEFVRVARTVLTHRQERLDLLPPDMFGEPAWDMLVQLYASGNRSAADPRGLAKASGVPSSIARRWIDYLEQHELLVRQVEDGVESLGLSSKAVRALDSYFCRVLTGRPSLREQDRA